MEKYKKIIRNAFERHQVIGDGSCKWNSDNIQIFEMENNAIKMVALIKGDFDRIFKMLNDVSFNTRSQWDVENLKHLQILENFDDDSIRVIRFNDYLGLYWSRKLKKTATILFKTCKHSLHSIDPAYDGEFFIYIKEIDDVKCYISIVTTLKTHKEYEIRRIRKIESIVNNLVKFNEIYSPWKCDLCRKDVPAHELECRVCKQERYKRCGDLKCYEAQRKNNIYCDFCGLLLKK